MKVLILPSWYFKAGASSITGLLFFEHALALRKLGVDAQIAYPGYSSTTWSAGHASFEVEGEVPTWRGKGWFPPKITSSIINIWIRKSGKALIQHFQANTPPDVVHAQGYQAAWVAEFFHQQTGIPYIVTEHFSGFLNQKIPGFHLPFIKSALDNAAFVTAVSPGLKDQLTTYTNAAISVVPNYYNPDLFFPDDDVRKVDHFQWLCIGEPIYTKGLDLVLEAFSSLVRSMPKENFRLILADKIPYQEVLERLANQLGILDSVDFTGLLLPDEIAGLMRQSHVLISASRYETFGKTMLEANACGIPVVASRTAGSTYILQSDKQGILCEQDSEKALAEAMIKMFYGYNTFHSVDIHTAVSTRFRREDIVQQWIAMYNNCTHDRRT